MAMKGRGLFGCCIPVIIVIRPLRACVVFSSSIRPSTRCDTRCESDDPGWCRQCWGLRSAHANAPLASAKSGEGAALVAVVADLQEVAAFGVFQGSHGEVVQQQAIDAGEPDQESADAAIGVRRGQFAKQFRGQFVQYREAIVAAFLRQRTSQPSFADAGGSEQEDALMLAYPIAVTEVRTNFRSRPRGCW